MVHFALHFPPLYHRMLSYLPQLSNTTPVKVFKAHCAVITDEGIKMPSLI